MPTSIHLTEKKTPMNATLTPMSATDIATTQPRSTAMSLINEALSRARMRSPQNDHSEARRSARRIAMEARKQQAREMGNIAQTYSLR
jgi:hypothetical protein